MLQPTRKPNPSKLNRFRKLFHLESCYAVKTDHHFLKHILCWYNYCRNTSQQFTVFSDIDGNLDISAQRNGSGKWIAESEKNKENVQQATKMKGVRVCHFFAPGLTKPLVICCTTKVNGLYQIVYQKWSCHVLGCIIFRKCLWIECHPFYWKIHDAVSWGAHTLGLYRRCHCVMQVPQVKQAIVAPAMELQIFRDDEEPSE